MPQDDASLETVLSALAAHPKVALSHEKMPLKLLENIGPELGVDLWAKRPNFNRLALSGNKMRQLEYYFEHAAAKDADTVLITGTVQSNFARHTSAATRRVEQGRIPPDNPGNLGSNVLFIHTRGATAIFAYPNDLIG